MFSVELVDDADAKRLWGFLKAHWREAAKSGKPLYVTVEVAQAPHTNRQRRRYHALLRTIAGMAWIGGKQHDHDWWHDHICRMYLGEEVDAETGELRPASTAELSVKEMNDLMAWIEHYVTDALGFELDVP